MPVIVSDTSPIRALANIDLLYALPALFGQVIVPPAVQEELLCPPDAAQAVSLSAVEGIRVVPLKGASRAAVLREILDPGESEALALAEELGADAILIDELAGRQTGAAIGLQVVGTLAVLLEAKERGLIGQILPLIDRLQADFGFFVSRALRNHVLRESGEL